MFLASEFTSLGVKDKEKAGVASPIGRPVPFVRPMMEILTECKNLGYENPKVAYCVGSPDVAYIVLHVARDQNVLEEKKWEVPLLSSKTVHGVDQRHLFQLLSAQHRGAFDKERVVFLPMTTLKGQRRFLAIVPETSEPVTATLQELQERHPNFLPSSRLLGSELSLYATVVRESFKPAEHENTAVIRVGSDDTLILFLAGNQLRHFERLRSLTTYDPPETVCSRVLLQQDEQKIGEVHHVLVLSEGRYDQFLTAFREFYPSASVEVMQEALFRQGVQPLEEDEHDHQGLRANSVPAVATALTLLEGWNADASFGAVNLLPKKLRKKSRVRQFKFGWHTAAMLILLFGVSYYYTNRYLEQDTQIEQSRQEMLMNPPDPALGSPAILQARVDSLKRVYTQYTHALHILDSLLVGSDQWSRMLEKTSRSTLELSGVWYTGWQPMGGSVRLSGYTTRRARVAQLANRLDASIERAAFEEVNDTRIHPFTMIAPRPIATPRVAEYLKYRADGTIDSSDAANFISASAAGEQGRSTTPINQ